MDAVVLNKAKVWLGSGFDEETQARVRYMIEKEPEELTECFYRDLEFGTGGLRGIMGVGTNRMNRYTVGMATQGLANYLIKSFPGEQIRIAIAHDSRNNSRFFSQVTANVLSSNGFTVFLFDDLRPTPELSFAIRHLKCHSGVVVTASHNPKEYNGYKVYWNDGGQLVAPHDTNVIMEVQKINDIYDVKFNGKSENIIAIGEEIDAAYIASMKSLSLSPDIISRQKDLKIVYTPLHGSGIKLLPRSLAAFGFTNVSIVKAQEIPDGNFPTIKSPNPEEKSAMTMALELARAEDAAIIFATDPDADRLGVGVKNNNDEFILLNGNQTASLLVYYILRRKSELGTLDPRDYIIKTIVTSELLNKIAARYKVESFDVLTGFKYIAEIIRNFEGSRKFLAGGEESYGSLVGDFVRDKDAIVSSCMISEIAAWAAQQGKTLMDILAEIYMEFGFYKEDMISITRKGISGAREIEEMMKHFRTQPLDNVLGVKIICIKDYLQSEERDLQKGKMTKIQLPKSNVLQFYLEDGSKITVRPSGTEPKIKFYFGVVGVLKEVSEFENVDRELGLRIQEIIRSFGLLD